MIKAEERAQIIRLIQREVVPAIGCTEPIAVALCVAKAAETLGCRPQQIDVRLSANILKNAMGVGIPGTGMIGLPIAIALGALIGKSDYQLEVLRDCTPEAVAEGRLFIEEKRIQIGLKEGITEKLYIEVCCQADGHQATAIIAGGHTHFIYLRRDEELLLDEGAATLSASAGEEEVPLSLRKVYEFATESPLDELRFILDTARLNKAAAERSFQGDYGHGLGRMLQGENEKRMMGDSIFSRILSYTSGACDARMAGAMIPVMSNSGSGNQGISATLPVVVYAEETHQSEERLIRALTLSHLTVIYIKQSLGRLSALCGCVVAATGSSCGITWLMGGDYQRVSFAVQNMIANLTGMICDGASNSCAMKVSTSASAAWKAVLMALDDTAVTGNEGIVAHDVEQSIANLCALASHSMQQTDRQIIEIMASKAR